MTSQNILNIRISDERCALGELSQAEYLRNDRIRITIPKLKRCTFAEDNNNELELLSDLTSIIKSNIKNTDMRSRALDIILRL